MKQIRPILRLPGPYNSVQSTNLHTVLLQVTEIQFSRALSGLSEVQYFGGSTNDCKRSLYSMSTTRVILRWSRSRQRESVKAATGSRLDIASQENQRQRRQHHTQFLLSSCDNTNDSQISYTCWLHFGFYTGL